MSKPRYVLELEPVEAEGAVPAVPPARRLARALKALLRNHGFRAVLASEMPEKRGEAHQKRGEAQ